MRERHNGVDVVAPFRAGGAWGQHLEGRVSIRQTSVGGAEHSLRSEIRLVERERPGSVPQRRGISLGMAFGRTELRPSGVEAPA